MSLRDDKPIHSGWRDEAMNSRSLICHGEECSDAAIHALLVGHTCMFVDYHTRPGRARNDKRG